MKMMRGFCMVVILTQSPFISASFPDGNPLMNKVQTLMDFFNHYGMARIVQHWLSSVACVKICP